MLSALLFCCTLTATFLLSCRWRCTVKCWISFTHWPDILLRSFRHLCSASQLLTLVFPAQSFFLNRDHWWLLALKCASVLFTFTSYTLVPTPHLPCTHTDLNKQPSVCLSVSVTHSYKTSMPKCFLSILHNLGFSIFPKAWGWEQTSWLVDALLYYLNYCCSFMFPYRHHCCAWRWFPMIQCSYSGIAYMTLSSCWKWNFSPTPCNSVAGTARTLNCLSVQWMDRAVLIE